MSYDLFVDLHNPKVRTEIVSRGQAHIHSCNNSLHVVLVPFGAQVVIIIDVEKENCVLPYPTPHKNGKMVTILSDSVGKKYILANSCVMSACWLWKMNKYILGHSHDNKELEKYMMQIYVAS